MNLYVVYYNEETKGHGMMKKHAFFRLQKETKNIDDQRRKKILAEGGKPPPPFEPATPVAEFTAMGWEDAERIFKEQKWPSVRSP